MFNPTTGTDSVVPAKLDPANCGRGGRKKVSFVLFQEFTNKESLWWFLGEKLRETLVMNLEHTETHTLTLSLSAAGLGRQLQGTVLP